MAAVVSLSYVHACWVIGSREVFWVSGKDTTDKKEGGEDTKEEELESFLYVGTKDRETKKR